MIFANKNLEIDSNIVLCEDDLRTLRQWRRKLQQEIKYTSSKIIDIEQARDTESDTYDRIRHDNTRKYKLIQESLLLDIEDRIDDLKENIHDELKYFKNVIKNEFGSDALKEFIESYNEFR